MTENDFDPLFVDAVRSMQEVASDCKVPVLLVGAFARDLLLRRLGLGSEYRRTRDVDFGVRIDSWDEFENLRDALLSSAKFIELGRESPRHRLQYRGQLEIDLVPFGGIADSDGKLRCWPNDFRQEMNVAGYEEALVQSERVHLGDLEIKALSLEAFVGLKILSWNDRPQERAKDAIDIAHVLGKIGTIDIVLEEAFSASEDEEWSDLDRRCRRWLGRKMASVFSPSTCSVLMEILDREIDGEQWRLAGSMRSVFRGVETALEALGDLREGIAAKRRESA